MSEIRNTAGSVQNVVLISPYSKKPFIFEIPLYQYEHTLTAPGERRSFKALVVTVRSKKSKKGKTGGLFSTSTREFTVRVVLPDGTEMRIDFNNAEDEMDLRARDKAAFIFDDLGKLQFVQNLTTGQHMKISLLGV
jgi:hypothetical protein